MATNPKTTTLQINKEYAEHIRDLANKEGMTVLDFTNQLLDSVLQNEVEVEVKVKTIKLKPIPTAGQ